MHSYVLRFAARFGLRPSTSDDGGLNRFSRLCSGVRAGESESEVSAMYARPARWSLGMMCAGNASDGRRRCGVVPVGASERNVGCKKVANEVRLSLIHI